MKKQIGWTFIFALAVSLTLAALAVPGASAAETPQAPDEKAFQEIKVLIFDQKWAEAGARLDEFLDRYPKSAILPQAVYYRGKCLEERGGREREALRSYRDFLEYRDQNRNLVEDAEVSIVDLAMALLNRGDKEAWEDLEARLTHPNRSVRQYAALQVSTLKDKRMAEMAIPILLLMAEKEANTELSDRAKIALLRIAPERLSGMQDEPPPRRRARVLRIEAVDENSRRVTLSLTLPWALADLALAAFPEEEKQILRAKGYDLQRITSELESASGRIVEIRVEGKRLRIWLE